MAPLQPFRFGRDLTAQRALRTVGWSGRGVVAARTKCFNFSVAYSRNDLAVTYLLRLWFLFKRKREEIANWRDLEHVFRSRH